MDTLFAVVSVVLFASAPPLTVEHHAGEYASEAECLHQAPLIALDDLATIYPEGRPVSLEWHCQTDLPDGIPRYQDEPANLSRIIHRADLDGSPVQ